MATMVKQIIAILYLQFTAVAAIAQIDLKPIGAYDSLMAEEGRETLVLITTPWCKWCEKMKSQDFNSTTMTEFNDELYFLELNGESEEVIWFNGYEYLPQPGDVHSLAVVLAGDVKVTYPSIVILNDQQEVIFQYAGYMDAKSLSEVIRAM